MDTSSLQELMDRLSQDLTLSEIAPPLLLANALQFIMDNEPEEEQKQLVNSICDRYWTLCDSEIAQAARFEHEAGSEGLSVYTVYIDAYGALVSDEEEYDASISIAAFVEPSDTIPADCAHQFALSVHKQRVSFAQQLENEMEEIQEQEHRKRVLEVNENNPDIKD
ncbi:MAG: hypothetical protein K6A68_15035 [Clostridiales bacterium]|nr:hypothetical protein [Clostridiales bacterium]